ncbi:hypothetical protein N7492_003327 [Penicillium capsulatum]|uniref:Extradiol ring-cleavage dioxygenase class III enzyme subunit B domain-containing protein n=1 Tax=Penicillium capsulatum TaxID=69766 RepID=A0A9W9ILT4_9EURO|nr:hypothetical protein N7492_003327 [Penicillium capsulatum]KAJ6122090.1 hypothetical protein N7512_004555 [Penicillium capsulatum]
MSPNPRNNTHHHSDNRGTVTLPTSNRKLFLFSVLAIIVAGLFAFFTRDPAVVSPFRRVLRWPFSQTVASTSPSRTAATAAQQHSGFRSEKSPIPAASKMKTPVYFLSHGGPNIMFDVDHPAYRKLGEIGREITQKVKPRAVVVFSAHWQGGQDTVHVNTAEITDLIYDFYGFPDHYYKEQYPNVGSKEVAHKVLDALQGAGIEAQGVKRGLDHGVWASFKCAFDPDSNPLNVPIVQASLFNTEDPLQHYKLGQAVARLREENILIIVSGMAVHNLRDLRFTFGDPRPMPYAVSFDEALKEAATTAPAEREKAMAQLLKRPDARQAHPSFDHLLPMHIGAGAAGEDLGKRIWTFPEGSMSWAQYRFGEIENAGSSL